MGTQVAALLKRVVALLQGGLEGGVGRDKLLHMARGQRVQRLLRRGGHASCQDEAWLCSHVGCRVECCDKLLRMAASAQVIE
jgi:hypothetical protein